MNQTLELIRGICLIVSLALLASVVLLRWLARTEEDRGWLISKCIISLLAFWIYWKGFSAGPFVVIYALISGGILAILWTGTVCRAVARPFGSFYDGGDEPPDPKPFYSVARALAARGKFSESVGEIQRQLEKFPGDFEGVMLLAETQAKNLRDLEAAATTVQEWCGQPGRPAHQISAALTALADWHLKVARDQTAAQNCLQQIAGLYPNSEFSAAAAQRLAHLGDVRMALPAGERNKFVVTEGIKNLGLQREAGLVRSREISPEDQAEELVRQLETHPLDTEAREKLAEIYAQHYGRVDLAAEQLEQLASQPDQPARNIVRWLNSLADLHVRYTNDYEAAKRTLQRIVDAFPGLAAAQMAQSRMELLRLEMKAKEKSQAVKLGSYEQNIGLKRGLPRG
jgi:tetratricopeptide (TPR) repeat protein